MRFFRVLFFTLALAFADSAQAFIFFGSGGNSSNANHANNIDNASGTNVYLTGNFSTPSGGRFWESSFYLYDSGANSSIFDWQRDDHFLIGVTNNGPAISFWGNDNIPEATIKNFSLQWAENWKAYYDGGNLVFSNLTEQAAITFGESGSINATHFSGDGSGLTNLSGGASSTVFLSVTNKSDTDQFGQTFGASYSQVTQLFVENDTAAGWDATNSWFTIPKTGIYQVKCLLHPRPGTTADNSGVVVTYGFAAVTTAHGLGDTPTLVWAQTGIDNGASYTTAVSGSVEKFNAGDQVMMEIYCFNEGFLPNSAAMSIVFLGN